MQDSSPTSGTGIARLSVWSRRLLRATGWLAAILYFAAALLVLTVRHAVLPGIDAHRGRIEAALSASLALPVAIGRIDARWEGLWPHLRISGLQIRDSGGRPALAFDHVEADIAWSSLWHFEPRFARLEILAPSLDIRRDAQGRLVVAGLEMKSPDPQQDFDFADWLLAQDRIVIRDAAITWHDELRAAPPLALTRLNFDLRNSGNRHRFGLTAQPPRQLAARLDLRGDFRGRDLDVLEAWKGQAYAELDYADLAGWRPWIDYPVEMPRGSGAVRVWLGIERRDLKRVTADVRIDDLAVRLAGDLPMLELAHLEGRLAGGRQDDGGYFATLKRLSLAGTDGTRIEPTDLNLTWQPSTGTRPARGDVAANGLELGVLAALAGHLPLSEAVRTRLAAFEPRGRIDDLHLFWSGEFGALQSYGIRGRFADLGMKAQGVLPGFAGMDGRIEGNEHEGVLELATRAAAVDLPAVFPEPKMAIARLDARARWRVEGGQVDVYLDRTTFENADAVGEASGHYRGDGQRPGEIDLTAALTRASGGAVWRYMPLVVAKEVRDWLRNSIVGGTASATLRLKGDLARFPFDDGSGIFEIRGPYRGASLRYAPGWPQFDDVAGELEFVRQRMNIRAQRATLWGVTLADVRAEIANLSNSEMLTITGGARGPTADFLRFIEASPVGESIEHITADMQAAGNGELRLRLDMPLQAIASTRVDGRYRFLGNGLVFDADMPPLAEINGDLHFTRDGIDAQKIRAQMLGAPMTVDVATEDGRAAIRAAGTMTVAGLRQFQPHPALQNLSGSAPWQGHIRVRKRAAEVRIESNLQGMSSSLPPPFNKTAGDTLPLVFERKPAPEPPRGRRPSVERPVPRDLLAIRLADIARVDLVRRHEGDRTTVERGLVAIGNAAATLPERGVLLAVQGPRVDADAWRRLNGNDNGSAPLPIDQLDLRADELIAYGRTVNALRVSGRQDDGVWRLDLRSREANGAVEWSSEGAGRLNARLTQLNIPEGYEGSSSEPAEPPKQMPAINLNADHFLLRGKDLGELKLRAENRDEAWYARFELRNEDGGIEGAGQWRPGGSARDTRMEFRLAARSVEKLLGRIGYPDTMRRGTASLEGALGWQGMPLAIDYPSLSGHLQLAAANGQFNKLEPGVGRLLGVFSLQSLPRRVSLDFRDVFSQGFAFDAISGRFTVERGVMETRDLQIQGPAAKVLMNGRVDLGGESQDLKVRVQPALGETVAAGVLLVNPAVGAAAWVMNKVFGNPLDKAFAFDYSVTGSWSDPKVEKVAAQGPGAEARAGAPGQ